MSNRRKTRRPGRPIPTSGKSLLVIGDGYYQLPASLADLEEWRQAVAAVAPGPAEAAIANALADVMADAIVTGNGVVDDADIDHMVILHWPDGNSIVLHAASLAAREGITEAQVWETLDCLVTSGALVRCKRGDHDGSCGDGGYRATIPPQEVIDVAFADLTGSLQDEAPS